MQIAYRIFQCPSKFDRTISYYDWVLNFSRQRDQKPGIAWYLINLGALNWEAGKLDQAAYQFAEALRLSQELGQETYLEAEALLGTGRVCLALGEYGSAKTYLQEALEKKQDWESHNFLKYIEAIALLAACQQEKAPRADLELAARQLGATEALHLKWQLTRTPRERQDRERTIAAVRGTLGEDAFTKAWKEGKAMTLEQAIAYAKEGDNT